MRLSAGSGQTISDASLASAVGLTVPSGAKSADITVEGQSVRYWDNGDTPTASVGMIIYAGTTLENYTGPLSALKLIRTQAGATVTVSYYKSAGPYQLS